MVSVTDESAADKYPSAPSAVSVAHLLSLVNKGYQKSIPIPAGQDGGEKSTASFPMPALVPPRLPCAKGAVGEAD